jgi:hypothetical protein
MMRHFAFALALAAGSALADDPDDAALRLADEAPTEVVRARDWQLFVEGAAGPTQLRDGTSIDSQRLSLDFLFDTALAPNWRFVFADRFDQNWFSHPVREDGINTWKEGYLSWQAQPDQIVDFGRVNLRSGVALGYNPTDYFRAGALRSIVSADPGSQKKNRQGSVMLRSQSLWSGGSLTALYSPKLASQPNTSTWSPDVGATNNQHRWLLAASHQLTEGISPQWLLYDQQDQAPQLGFNLAALLNNATVGYVEWSGGRSRSLLSQALNLADDTAFRNHVATGLTYTTENKISLTLEYQYNGAALHEAEWNALPRQSLPAYVQYRKVVQNLQEMPTRDAAFFYGTWQDAMISHVDISTMLRYNVADHSKLSWLEARYHWERSEVALQWQRNSGSVLSEFGAVPQSRIVQLLLRHFF